MGHELSDGEGIIIDDNSLSQVKNKGKESYSFVGATLVQDNTIVFCGGSGIQLYSSHNIDVLNNTTWHNTQSFPGATNWAEINAYGASSVNIHDNICVPATQAKVPVLNIGRASSGNNWNDNLFYGFDVTTIDTLVKNNQVDPYEAVLDNATGIITQEPKFIKEPQEVTVPPSTSKDPNAPITALLSFSGAFDLRLQTGSPGQDKGFGIITVNGVSATPGNGSVTLKWNATTGATAYNVKRLLPEGTGYETIKSVTVTSYTDSKLTNGLKYFYEVSALYDGGESANSDPVNATPESTKLPKPPVGPLNLVAKSGDSSVTLTWSASSGATDYNVKRSSTSGTGFETITSVSGTSYTDLTADNGTKYYYVVSAGNSGGESSNSNQASATPEPPKPAAPSSLVAKAGDSSVTLTWRASSGATSYNVKRSTASGTGFVTIQSSVDGTTYTDPTAHNGTKYYYEVSAVNGGGEGASSIQASATPEPVKKLQPPGAPTNLVALAGNGTVGLTWNSSVSGATYNVKRSLTSGTGYGQIKSMVTGTTYTDPAATNGTKYYYEVSAVTSGGESANSNQASATPNANSLVDPLSFAQWLTKNGLRSTTSLTDIPDADGISVLLKYALALPVGTSTTNGVTVDVAGDHLTLSFTRTDPAPVTYIIEGSTDLQGWTTIATLKPESSTWNNANNAFPVKETSAANSGLKVVTATDPYSISHNSRRFLRVRVNP